MTDSPGARAVAQLRRELAALSGPGMPIPAWKMWELAQAEAGVTGHTTPARVLVGGTRMAELSKCVVTTETSESAPRRCPMWAKWAVTLDGETESMCDSHALRAASFFGATCEPMAATHDA
jgi:hypothetical protein